MFNSVLVFKGQKVTFYTIQCSSYKINDKCSLCNNTNTIINHPYLNFDFLNVYTCTCLGNKTMLKSQRNINLFGTYLVKK